MSFSFLSTLLLFCSVVTGRNRTYESIYAVSDRAPIATALGRYPTSRKAVSTLVAHFIEIGASVRMSPSCTTSTLNSWVSLDLRARFPGGKENLSGCVAQIQLPKEGNRVWKAIDALDRALNASGTEIISEVGVNWNRVRVYVKGIHNPFSAERCKMHSIGAFRANGKWMLAVSLTSSSVQRTTFFETSVLTEYISETGQAFRSSISKADGRRMNRATTTLLNTYPGRHFGCCTEQYYREMFIKHRKWIVYASETLRASNIATMVLPLLLSLLPMALFVESSTAAGLFYALLTNVVNVLPLTFKGAELIKLARNPPLSTNTMTFGLDRPERLGVAATWVLRCEIEPHLYDVGVWFIGVSMMAMILGLCLEVQTRRKHIRDKMRYKLDRLNDPHRG